MTLLFDVQLVAGMHQIFKHMQIFMMIDSFYLIMCNSWWCLQT